MPVIAVHIHDLPDYRARLAEQFARLDPSITLLSWEEALARPARVDYALVWCPPAGDLRRFGNLKAILSSGAGVDHIVDRDPDWPAHLPLVRMGGDATALLMGDYVLWACLTLLRDARSWALRQHDHEWARPTATRGSAGCTIGVMGMGHLGGHAAQRLRQAGFAVRGWSRRPAAFDGIAHFAGPEALEPFLSGTDILVCLLPNTPSTRHIIDAGLLARLRPGGGVVNVARGDHLVVDDLIQALDSGHLAGAVLDVFEHEPLPPSSPLWGHPRITITPHVASEAPIADRARYIRDVIAQIARGERPALTFDPARGY